MKVRFDTMYFYALLFFAFASGYLYTSYSGNILNLNHAVRGVILLVLFVSVFLPVMNWTAMRSTMPMFLIAFWLFGAYIVLVATVRGEISGSLASAMRLCVYMLCFYWAYFSPKPLFKLRNFALMGGALIIAQVIFDYVIGRGYFINGVYRVGGGVGSAIGLACVVYVFALLNFFVFLQERRFSYLGMFMALTGAVVATGTRSILVALLFSVLVLAIFSYRGFARKLTAMILATGLVGLIGYFVVAYTDLGARFLFTSLGEDSSTGFRVLILRNIISGISEHEFLFGIGLGGFPIWFEAMTGFARVAPHFEAVWLLVEGGLLGAAIYLFAMFQLVRTVKLRVRRDNYGLYIFTLFLGFSPMLAMHVANPNYFYQAMMPIAFLMGGILRNDKALIAA